MAQDRRKPLLQLSKVC